MEEKTEIKIGDVFSIFLGEQIKYFSAIQIIDHFTSDDSNYFVFVDLDYYSLTEITSEITKTTPILLENRLHLKDNISLQAMSYTNLNDLLLPANYSLVGNMTLPDGLNIVCGPYAIYGEYNGKKFEHHGIGNLWPNSSCIYENWWMQHPESERKNYKSAYAANEDLVVFGRECSSRDETIDLANLEIDNFSELDKLGCLTSIHFNSKNNGLVKYLEQRMLIGSLTWENCTENKLDISKTNIDSLTLKDSSIDTLIVGELNIRIYLDGSFNPNLKIIHHANGKGVYFSINELPDGKINGFSLSNLENLRIDSTRVNAEDIAEQFPKLKSLFIHGMMGKISNLNSLKSLEDLNVLYLFETFGYTADDFPSKHDWRSIQEITMQCYPFELTKKVKSEFSHCKILELRQPKKTDWVEANVNNPFRSWENTGVSTKNVKKAFVAFNKASTNILKLKPTSKKDDALSIVKKFITDLNEISDEIMTAERESIGDAYNKLVKLSRVEINSNEAEKIFDELRDF